MYSKIVVFLINPKVHQSCLKQYLFQKLESFHCSVKFVTTVFSFAALFFYTYLTIWIMPPLNSKKNSAPLTYGAFTFCCLNTALHHQWAWPYLICISVLDMTMSDTLQKRFLQQEIFLPNNKICFEPETQPSIKEKSHSDISWEVSCFSCCLIWIVKIS